MLYYPQHTKEATLSGVASFCLLLFVLLILEEVMYRGHWDEKLQHYIDQKWGGHAPTPGVGTPDENMGMGRKSGDSLSETESPPSPG